MRSFYSLTFLFALWLPLQVMANSNSEVCWVDYETSVAHIPEYQEFVAWEKGKRQELAKKISLKRTELLSDINEFKDNVSELSDEEAKRVEKRLVKRRFDLLATEKEWEIEVVRLIDKERSFLRDSLRMHLSKFMESNTCKIVFEKQYLEKKDVIDLDEMIKGHQYILFRLPGVSPLKAMELGSVEDKKDLTTTFVRYLDMTSS